MKRLIDFVVADGGGDSVTLTLQDIALCQLWLEGQRRKETDDDALPKVERRLQAWIASPDVPEMNTAGRRHQRLPRLLLNRLAKGQIDALGADEVAFLCAARDLVAQSGSEQSQARYCELIAPHLDALRERLARRPPSNDVHQLETHIAYVSGADVRAAPVNSIRLLAGIELPCRGPIYKAGNHLRILGDVPENCTVVVENDASCSVEGYVLGRVLTKSLCEIRHNISGVVIVLRGHVRARCIINNALVISKMGRVVCRSAEGPKLVFAGTAIDVFESTMLGKFVTRDLAVGGDVRGSHLEVAGDARARRIQNLGTGNSVVVLRRELSCEDFGEVTGDELRHLLSRAYALRRSARNFTSMASAARTDAEHLAQSALMYIFGGGEVQKRLQGFLHVQRRHTLASNVVDNLEHILEQAQDALFSIPEAAGDAVGHYDGGADLAEDDELMGARAEAERLQKSLRAKNLNRLQRTLILEEVRQKLSDMRAVQRRAADRMKEEERSIQHLEKYEQVLAGSGAGATKVDVLNNILPAMQQQPPESTMGKRLRSNFIVRTLRGVDRAVGLEREFRAKAEEALADFRAVTERLGKDYQIRILENPESEEWPARVTAVFDGGVRIFTDVFVENTAEAPGDSFEVTRDDDGVRTYVRRGAGDRFHSPAPKT